MPYRIVVRELAEQQGLSKSALARKAGVNIKTVRAIWDDPSRNTSTGTLDKLAEALGVPVEALMKSMKG